VPRTRDNHKTKEQLLKEMVELRQRIAESEQVASKRKQAEKLLKEHEENFRALAENAADGIAILTSEGTHAYVNRQAAEIAGYTVDELLQVGFQNLFPQDELKRLMEIFRKKLRGESDTAKYETVIIRKDGTRVPLEVSSVLTAWHGEPADIVFSRDITKRKQTEEALRDSEERYRAIFEQSPFGVGISSLDGKVVASNKAMEAITGYSGAELKKIRLIDTYEDAKDRKALLKAIRRYGNVVDFPARLKRKDGTGYDALLNISRIKLGSKVFFHAICQDITERKRAEEAPQESEERYRTLVDHIDRGINLIDSDHTILMVNALMGKRFNKPLGDLIGKKCFREFEKRDAVCPHCPGVQTMTTGKPAEVETEGVRDDGSRFDVRLQTFPVFGQDGEVSAFIEISEDITARKRAQEALRESEEKYRTILATMEEGYYEVDLAGNFTFFNDSMCRIQGYTRDEMMGMNNRAYMDEKAVKKVYKIFNAVYRTGHGTTVTDWQIIRKDGSRGNVEASVSLMRDAGGNPIGFRGVVRDITERKRAEEELEYMATHDALTDLPNRPLFADRLTMALAQARRSQKTLAVMMLDLDYFKDVNDSLGHSVGDHLLRAVGNRLRKLLRQGDTVARIGGDEFLLLLPEIAQPKDTNTVAQKILKAFREPFTFDDHELYITTSIGIAIFPNDGDDVDTLMKNADIAMYRAKDKGRDTFERYLPEER